MKTQLDYLLADESAVAREVEQLIRSIRGDHQRYVAAIDNIVSQYSKGRKDFIDRCAAAVEGHRAISDLHCRNVLDQWEPTAGQIATWH